MRPFFLFICCIALFTSSSCTGSKAAWSADAETMRVEKDSIFEKILEKRLEESDIPRPKGMIGAEPLLDPNQYATVPVYYATDRKPSGKDDPYRFYSGKPDPEGLHFGKCMVTIPAIHELGEIERPLWWKVEFSESPGRHMVLKEVRPLDEAEFFSQLHWDALVADKKEALVFIHGFNVSFDEAALRAAQIAYDVSFKGVPVCYSWPSAGKVTQYRKDGRQNNGTIPNLEYFLETLAAEGQLDQIHIVAHSMGNQALTQTLVNLARENPKNPLFGQVILAAPDVDAKTFVQDIAPLISSTAQNITLYASSKDKALLLSQKIHKGPRAGTAGEHLVLSPHLETIDASHIDTDFLGHSYFSNTWLLINDLHALIHKGLKAPMRPLQESERNNWIYWFF